ncbi:MAG: type III-B CRISPR-associated protein Cas10/Cmr2 [Armatimonadota bacterium]|nr:type III-B CRISPR-associated protein Cas10/Cmr2 [Armatimonadota bacterium]
MTNRWQLKTLALLHDPPAKALVLRSQPHTRHTQLAGALQIIALGRPATSQEDSLLSRADQIASAADRINFPANATAFWDQVSPCLVHPLSRGAQPHSLALPHHNLGDLEEDVQRKAAQKIRQWLSQFTNDPQKEKGLYLFLWRHLFSCLAQTSQVGPLIQVFPADTRQPDHSLQQHLSLTAAIADALPHPALLIFSIGPVQGFLAAARRTQDLWMGSWLLAYLSWKAMESIAEEFGPDVFLYPSLRGQPLCDRWLTQCHNIPSKGHHPRSLSIATFPNKFVALLPTHQAEAAARNAEEAVSEAWSEIARRVRDSLTTLGLPCDSQVGEIWKRQTDGFWEVYWVVLPWPGAQIDPQNRAHSICQWYQKLFTVSEDWAFGRIYQTLSQGGQYQTNWGTVYSLIYSVADRFFNSRKSLRTFSSREEQGDKCTVCGERSALSTCNHSARDFWKAIGQALRGQQRYDIKPDGQERLCAVCTIKRFVQREFLERKMNLKGGFPSTSEMAVVPFKMRCLKALHDGDSRVIHALNGFLQQAKNLLPQISDDTIPYLKRLSDQINDDTCKRLATDLLRLDGEWLISDDWTVKRVQEVSTAAKESDVITGRQKLEDLYDVLGDTPSRYFAILYMDGDHAGRWLSGTHPGLAHFKDILHPKVRQQLDQTPGWGQFLNTPRVISPAVHAAISDALTQFALKVVPWVVEERYPGRLIYAGGDDVLALVPLSFALSVARELRALFSGHLCLQKPLFDHSPEEELPINFSAQVSGYLKDQNNSLLMTMGPAATASIGIAFGHHLHPLDLLLFSVRLAERSAKELYSRNALCVHLLKRSGEEIRVGAQWFYDRCSQDTVALILHIYQLFLNGHLSMRTSRAIFEESSVLEGLPPESQKAELKRLLTRHWQLDSSKDHSQQAETLSNQLIQLADALNTQSSQMSERGLEQVAKWLLLCRFLAGGGRE